jgi:hypothetical protein
MQCLYPLQRLLPLYQRMTKQLLPICHDYPNGIFHISISAEFWISTIVRHFSYFNSLHRITSRHPSLQPFLSIFLLCFPYLYTPTYSAHTLRVACFFFSWKPVIGDEFWLDWMEMNMEIAYLYTQRLRLG